MRLSWIVMTAGRFLKNRRSTRGLAASYLSIAGIAVGVMALLVVLSVMNGFQMGFIDDILEISSYHIRVTTNRELRPDFLKIIRLKKGVRAMVVIADTHTLIQSAFSGLETCKIRGVPPLIEDYDQGFLDQLNVNQGVFEVDRPNTIVLGSELAAALGIAPGMRVSVFTLAGAGFTSLTPEQVELSVTGLFSSGYYDFDRSFAVVSLDTLFSLEPETGSHTYGIKLTKRSDVTAFAKSLAALPELENASIDSWQSYNEAFFTALRTEKLAMVFLLSLIFVVSGFNTYHALKRAIFEKREQIALLRAVGASPRGVQLVFVLDGFLIGAIGGLFGLLAGLLIAGNINAVFSLTERLVNWIIRLLSPFLGAAGGIAIFSPVYFYLSEVPLRILAAETICIFLFAVCSSLTASYLAARRISLINPAQVLRYE
ncbi:MAG: hypothetical protein CMN78_01755 [Spirochaetales bacterium]|nr:hypothetical protein [Spirochaetales bacterium]